MVAGVYTHIKRVHMEGFRSYKDQTSDDGVLAFSKHTNVISMHPFISFPFSLLLELISCSW